MKYMILLVVCVLCVTPGCSKTSQKDASSSPNQNMNTTTKNQMNNKQMNEKQTLPPKLKIDDPEGVAAHLEMLSTRIPQVKSANCVVFGNTAVVGLNIDGQLDSSRVGVIKYSVAEALHKDPYGVHAIVTADMDLAQRISAVRKSIKNGKPVSGFAKEMGQIISRIVPQLPQPR